VTGACGRSSMVEP